MTTPELVAPKFVALALTVAGVRSALDHEPGAEGLPKRPCVTMLYKGPRIVDQATGGVVDVEHVWDVFVYLDVRGRFRDPQLAFAQLLPALQLAVAGDRSLGGSCEIATLRTEPDEQPELVKEMRQAWKRLELVALQSESSL